MSQIAQQIGAAPWRTRRIRWDVGSDNPPAGTPDLLANTSIVSPAPPPAGLTIAQRREADRTRQQLEELRLRARQEARRRHAARQQRDYRRAMYERANEAWEALHAYQQENCDRVRDAFVLAYRNFQRLPSPLLAEFNLHLDNALRASAADVRRLNILSWFDLGPFEELISAIRDLALYYHEEAIVQYTYHDLDFRAGGLVHDTCDSSAACNLDVVFDVMSDRRFGYEIDWVYNGFASYAYSIKEMDDLQHLKANFEVRKLRMADARNEERFGLNGIERLWSTSLDSQMNTFLTKARTATDPVKMEAAVRAEWSKLGSSTASINQQVLRLVRASATVGADLVKYQTDLQSRKATLEALYARLIPLQDRTNLSTSEMGNALRWIDELRCVMMQGINDRGRQIDTPFDELERSILASSGLEDE